MLATISNLLALNFLPFEVGFLFFSTCTYRSILCPFPVGLGLDLTVCESFYLKCIGLAHTYDTLHQNLKDVFDLFRTDFGHLGEQLKISERAINTSQINMTITGRPLSV